MKVLYALFLVLGLGASLVGRSGGASAQVWNNQLVSGVNTGWGSYPVIDNQWGWRYYGQPAWSPYGYSYFPYWNYQAFYSSFAALAYSPSTGLTGWAYGYPTAGSASLNAVAYCGAWDCATTVWVQGGCAATAKSPYGNSVTWGYHTNKFVAIDKAMNECLSNGAAGCAINAWVCSY